jgi:hypothetical protein
MEDNKEPLSPKEQARQRKKEMREKGMDLMFGKNRHQYAGNIWGWKFSMISLIGLLLVVSFMSIGIATGNINIEEHLQNAKAKKAKIESKLKVSEKPDSLSN